jgi:hypothetical protein
MPNALALGDALAPAHDAKATAPVERQAGSVLGEDGGLERPYGAGFRLTYHLDQKSSAHPVPAGRLAYIDTHFGHALIRPASRDWAERGPTQHLPAGESCQARKWMVGRVPVFPIRRAGFESRQPAGDTLQVDLAHLRPIFEGEWSNLEIDRHSKRGAFAFSSL